MSRVDRALKVLDAGMQSSTPEHDDVWMAPPGRCTRCRNRDTTHPERGLCDLCRAYLLGDSDLDPTTDVVEVIQRFMRRFAEVVAEVFGPVLDLFVALPPSGSRRAWRRMVKAAALVEHHRQKTARIEARLHAAENRPWKLDHARLSKARRR